MECSGQAWRGAQLFWRRRAQAGLAGLKELQECSLRENPAGPLGEEGLVRYWGSGRGGVTERVVGFPEHILQKCCLCSKLEIQYMLI